MIALAAGSRHSAAFCSQRRPTQYCSPTPHAAAQQHTGGASAAAAAAARAPLRLQCRLQAPCQRATAARSSAADTQGTPSSGGNDGIHLPASEGLTSAAATSLAIKELEEAAADVLGSAAAPAEGEAEVDTTEGLLQSKELREMLAFAVPALGMVLADPLMSLIDTGEGERIGPRVPWWCVWQQGRYSVGATVALQLMCTGRSAALPACRLLVCSLAFFSRPHPCRSPSRVPLPGPAPVQPAWAVCRPCSWRLLDPIQPSSPLLSRRAAVLGGSPAAANWLTCCMPCCRCPVQHVNIHPRLYNSFTHLLPLLTCRSCLPSWELAPPTSSQATPLGPLAWTVQHCEWQAQAGVDAWAAGQGRAAAVQLCRCHLQRPRGR